MQVTLLDEFWAPRVEQLRVHTLPVMLERLESQGVVDNFRRLGGPTGAPRRAMHFSDSDLYKWLEAATLARRLDFAEPVIDLVEAVQHHDGYLHTYYDAGADSLARYTDLDFGHEHYCAGHLIEAALAHRSVTGSDRLLAVATRLADHLVATFGPGRDERTDAHPEIELALTRLAGLTGEERYLDHARWIVEQRLAHAGTSVPEFRLGGHAVRALYFASAIAEIADATSDRIWSEATARLFDALLDQHSYPTGAVGGRWLGEAVGKPYEQPDTMAYAESCAAVAAVQFCDRVWRVTGDPRALDQVELLLFNAVPAGVGATGDEWFYSQPHAVAEVDGETNPWVTPFDYGDAMVLAWFPARRHRWFTVPCCPPNLARMFASVGDHVASVDASGDLLVHVPVSARCTGDGWDVEIASGYPRDGSVAVTVHGAPPGHSVRVRRPGWAGGRGHEPVGADGLVTIPVDWQWWETDRRVEGAGRGVFLRKGPVVHCVEGVDVPGVDLRDLVVDPSSSPDRAFSVVGREPTRALHRRVRGAGSDPANSVRVPTIPYAEWANRGVTTMRMRFPTR